jgi:hypothetical protein
VFLINGKGAIHNTVLNPLLPQQRMSIIEIRPSTFISCLKMSKNKLKLFILVVISLTFALAVLLIVSLIRYKMIEYKIERFERHLASKNSTNQDTDTDTDTSKPSKFTVILSYDICNMIDDQFFEDYILVFISFPLTIVIYLWNAYRCNIDHAYHCNFSNIKIKKQQQRSAKNLNETMSSYSDQSVTTIHESAKVIKKEREKKTKSVLNNFCFTCSYLWHWLRLDRFKRVNCTMCGLMCSCNFTFPVPSNPFSKKNRFITAVIYAAYTYNILKIFEYLIVGDQHIQASNRFIERNKHILANGSLKNLSIDRINKGVLNKYDEVAHSFNTLAEVNIKMSKSI